MKKATAPPHPAGPAAEVAELRALVTRLAERLAALEAATPASLPAAAPGPGPAAPPESAAAPEPEPVSEELLLVLSAAVAAYLGKRPVIRQIRILGSEGWAHAGRVSVQGSHALR